MSRNSLQNLFSIPKRPTYLESIRLTGKKSYIVITSALLALIISILSWIIPTPPIKIFFQWLILFLVVCIIIFLVIAIVIYIIQINKYLLRLETRILQIRKVILTYSGIVDIDSDIDLAYRISGIADQKGTVNLLIDLSDKFNLRQGSLLDVVVSATGDIWGFVEVCRIIDQKAWAIPKDRRNPEFWESLEDRMKVNPAPPPGIHLEPSIPIEIRKLLTSAVSLER